MKNVYVSFNGDPSVDIFSYSFQLEIPDFDEEFREEIREKISELYTFLDGESKPTFIIFTDDETMG